MLSWFRKKDKDKSVEQPATTVEEQCSELEALQPDSVAESHCTEPAIEQPAPQSVEPIEEPQAEQVIEPETEMPKQAEVEPVEPLETISEPEPEPEPEAQTEPESPQEQPMSEATAPVVESKQGWFARLRQGLAKTSANFGEGVATLFLGRKTIDDELFEDLETHLLTADVGVEATTGIVTKLTQRVARKELADSDALYHALQAELQELLEPVEQPMQMEGKSLQVILVVGVNGAGKTTTIGKLASRLQKEGKKVMLAAGDTFRAAAVEQLQVWGERNKVPVIAQHTGADSASVIFDAVQAAQARGADVLIADTAGRLHNKDNLMEELKKIQRVMSRLDESAPHEVLLVLDAGTGQNAINQTRQFNEAVKVTGLVLTKLDGTAKGGVIFALAKQFAIPVRFIGVGEGIDDLRPFVAKDFVKALFSHKESE